MVHVEFGVVSVRQQVGTFFLGNLDVTPSEGSMN